MALKFRWRIWLEPPGHVSPGGSGPLVPQLLTAPGFCQAYNNYAIGEYIQQLRQNKKIHPVTFYSKKIFPAEMNYDIYDKELLTVITAFQEWKVYLKGVKYQIKVFTDY